MGARTIEAHFTDKSIKSDFRDHIVSKTADDFKERIKFSDQVRNPSTDRMKNHYWKLKKQMATINPFGDQYI